MASNSKPLTARCPECDSRIYFERRPDTGEMISCPECDTLLEVISVAPLRLDWASEEPVGAQTNWDDDFFGRDTDEDEIEDEDDFDD
jgi:lysine biosynthesis protein LysW